MTTWNLSVIKGSGGPIGPLYTACVTKGTAAVAAAAINVKIDTGIAPNLSYSDAIAMLQSTLAYLQSDYAAAAASRNLTDLTVP